MVYLDSASIETVSIRRYTAGTRNTQTTIHASVSMDVQPAGGGSQFDDMSSVNIRRYHGFVATPLTGVVQGDVVRRSDGQELYINRIDSSGTVQEFILTDAEQLVL